MCSNYSINKGKVKECNSAFTLVELAIVIVILGLIVAGIMVGSEIVSQAKSREFIKEIEGYDSSTSTFMIKYKALPGDINNASILGLNTPKGSVVANIFDTIDAQNDGDGDKALQDGTGGYTTYNGEIGNFWIHLSNSNIIQQEYVNSQSVVNGYPNSKYGTAIVALSSNGALYWVTGISSTLTNLNSPESPVDFDGLINNKISPEQLFNVDSKIDDGNPVEGNVRVITRYLSTGVFQFDTDVTGDNDDCMTSLSEYNLATDAQVCTASIRSSI